MTKRKSLEAPFPRNIFTLKNLSKTAEQLGMTVFTLKIMNDFRWLTTGSRRNGPPITWKRRYAIEHRPKTLKDIRIIFGEARRLRTTQPETARFLRFVGRLTIWRLRRGNIIRSQGYAQKR